MLPDVVRIRHMLQAAQLALQFVEGVDRLGGCAEVARHQLGTGNGHSCRLTEEQLAELATWAAEGTFFTYEDARQRVKADAKTIPRPLLT